MPGGIVRPSPQELFGRYRDLFSQIVLGGAKIVPESNEWYAVSLNYAAAEEFYAISAERAAATDPRTACCEDLARIAALDGIYPRPAIAAQGYAKVTGTPGASLPYPLSFDLGGFRFYSAGPSAQPAAIGPDGTATIRIRAEQAGAFVPTPSAALVLATSVPGVNRNATLCGALCGGQNAETCDEFRARYLRRLRTQPRARMDWVRDKIMEWPCVTRVLVRGGSCCNCTSGCNDNCNCRNCGGRMHFYAMFDGTFPNGIAPPHIVAEVERWFFGDPQGYGLGEVEIGICGRIFPVTPFPVRIGVSLPECASLGDMHGIEAALRDFFATLVPSEPVTDSAVAAAVAQAAGITGPIEINFVPSDPSQAYGPAAPNPAQTPDSLAYLSGCSVEPECDVLPVLDGIRFAGPGQRARDCG